MRPEDGERIAVARAGERREGGGDGAGGVFHGRHARDSSRKRTCNCPATVVYFPIVAVLM
jgi:hypothetical protein